jgi:murein DD-endopeptidase MepM/ murein hydrolase activator NlpD
MTRQRILSIATKIFAGSFVLLLAGFIIPQKLIMPVERATMNSYSQNSFWAYPWGKSVTHKGVDIFAKKGTAIHAATPGLVVSRGKSERGGNYVLVLGTKWRLHYYAHLDEIKTKRFSFVSSNTVIGTVGNTGNAIGKPSHLHYTIKTIIPYPWQMDKGVQGKRKMFYLNPIKYLNKTFT